MRRMMATAMLAGMMLAGPGRAAVQIVSYTGSGNTVAFVPLFDTALGSLQSASISASYTLSEGFRRGATVAADHAVNGQFTLGSLAFALAGTTMTTVDSSPFGLFTVMGSGSGSFSGASQLALLTGSSLALAAQVSAPAPGMLIAGSPMAAVGYTIAYSYDDGRPAPAAAVPEPASWAMLIAGFGLIGATLRNAHRGRRAVRLV